MKLFDKFMKHEVDLAYVESDENVRNIEQLLDAKLEDMSKKNRTSKLWNQHIKMLEILRKFNKAERTENWMLHLQSVRGHNAYTKSGHIYLCRMADYHLHIKWLFCVCRYMIKYIFHRNFIVAYNLQILQSIL